MPIPSTRTPSHLDENLAAADVPLDAPTLARIDELAPAGAAAGQPSSSNQSFLKRDCPPLVNSG